MADREGWTDEEFEGRLYSTKAFQEAFPGIFRKNGSLRMPPSEYNELRDAYSSKAREYGVKVNKEQFGRLVTADVSVDELEDRLSAIQQVRENPQMWSEFAKWANLPEHHQNPQAMANFLLGKAPGEFYKDWEKAQIGFESYQAGIGGDLSKSDIKYIAKNTGEGWQADRATLQTSMQALAKDLMTTMPLSQLQKNGITKRDLIQLEFGGPNQEVIFQKARRIMATAVAQTMKRGHLEGKLLEGYSDQAYGGPANQ
jgi:hypothetical protein